MLNVVIVSKPSMKPMGLNQGLLKSQNLTQSAVETAHLWDS